MNATLDSIETLTREGYSVLIRQKYNDVDDFYFYVVSVADDAHKVVSIGEGTIEDAMTEAYMGTPEK